MSVLNDLKARRLTLHGQRSKEFDGIKPEDFNAEREARFDELTREITKLDGRIAEMTENEEREARAAKFRKGWPGASDSEVRKTAGGVALRIQDRPLPEVYTRDGEHSFFGDILMARVQQDRAASERLVQNQHAQNRALTTSAGAGGEFAPPMWLVNDFIELARPARVTADLMNKYELPTGVSSMNLPAVDSGTAVGITQTQATAITQTDMTSTSLSSGITTISGGQTLSIEQLRQSGTSFDQVVLQDLAAAYASKLDSQVLTGTGSNGELAGLVTSGTTVTFTTTAPTVVSTTTAASFYHQVIKASNTLAKTRFLPADAIIMSPSRWHWCLDALDGDGRPIISAGGTSVNSIGSLGNVTAEGAAGTLAGLPVYLDPNIPTNLGAATNQDVVMVIRRSDNYLWESPLLLSTHDDTYAPSNAVFVRALGFASLIPRRAASVQIISGTGLVDPGLG